MSELLKVRSVVSIPRGVKLLVRYLLFSALFAPIVAAPFTGGASLIFYVLWFMPSAWPGVLWILAPGLFLWLVHQFVRWALVKPAIGYVSSMRMR